MSDVTGVRPPVARVRLITVRFDRRPDRDDSEVSTSPRLDAEEALTD